LIRKDGRPDQRSISSPKNLRKVHDKKLLTAGTSTESPLARDITAAVRNGDDESTSGVEDVSMEGMNVDGSSDSPIGQAAPNDKHSSIMNAMFPNGMQGDSQRMNPSAKILSPTKPRMQARVDAERDGIRAAIRDEDGVEGVQEQGKEEREDSMEII